MLAGKTDYTVKAARDPTRAPPKSALRALLLTPFIAVVS